jgi:hypothetical protein
LYGNKGTRLGKNNGFPNSLGALHQNNRKIPLTHKRVEIPADNRTPYQRRFIKQFITRDRKALVITRIVMGTILISLKYISLYQEWLLIQST